MTTEQINGVSLFTKSGIARTRFSTQDRVKICGGTETNLEQFIELFCPGEPLYARTQSGTDDPRAWMTPHGRLPADEVAKHLIGNATPGNKPSWVAPRSWEVTRWAGIDVDYRGDIADFRNRCTQVRRALASVGIRRKQILTSITPSGGRHFRIFFAHKIRVYDIAGVMSRIGLIETAGKIEIFPKLNKGLRLPFGYLPGRPHDPTKWVRFIRIYTRRGWPLVDWRKMDDRANILFKKARGDSLLERPEPHILPSTRVNRTIYAGGPVRPVAQGRRPDVDSLAALSEWSGLDVDQFMIGASEAPRSAGRPLEEMTALFRADPNLSPEAATAIETTLKVLYEQLRGDSKR